MPWWKSTDYSSSSSSSPTSSSSASHLPLRDVSSIVTCINPRLTRQKKLRHLTDVEVGDLAVDRAADGGEGGDRGGGKGRRGGAKVGGSNSTPVSRNPSCIEHAPNVPARVSCSAVLLPQPLPLPEAVAAAAGRHALPSPRLSTSVPVAGEERNSMVEPSSFMAEPVGERLSVISIGSKFVQPTGGLSPEPQITIAGFSPQITIAGFSSPLLSPRRLSTGDAYAPLYMSSCQIPQMWSAPELPSVDFLAGLASRTSTDRISASPEKSSYYSPKVKGPGVRPKNPSADSSPLHPKLFSDNSSTWLDNNGNVNVHPLPLPPGALTSSPPSHPHQTPKSEVMSMGNQWQKGKLIGCGTFGRVYIATNRNTGALCAMKEVNLIPDDPKSAECIKQLQQEIKLLSKLKHPNIVQYYGSEIIEDRFYIYLEYVYPGSINKYVNEHCGAITESVVRNFTRHILRGLAYLHSTKTMHRDIKGANLLVDSCGVVKLADFGMAKHLSGARDELSIRGTPYWMAPEVLQSTMNKELSYDLAVDIWSLGCTIIEMFTGKHPWSGFESAAAMFKVLHESPQIPETLSSEGKDFLQCCFRRNPAERPAASQLLEHPFVKNTHHNHIHSSPSTLSFSGAKISEPSYATRGDVRLKSSSVKGKLSNSGSSCISPP